MTDSDGVEIIELPASNTTPIVVESGQPQDAGATVISIDSTGGGGSGGTQTYVYAQNIPQAVWQVQHNLGRNLTAWSLFDEDGNLCGEYQVQNVSELLARVSMDIPTAGTFRYI